MSVLHDRLAMQTATIKELTAERDVLKAAISQVDDVLVVNLASAKDGNYRQALADLVTLNIAEYDDPCISSVAKARQDEFNQLLTALRETREALEFVIGDHNIPGDCYSTGPVTGTPLDAVCPSCSGIRVLARHAGLAGEEKGAQNEATD